ncbi:hypothetical protein GWI33_017649 [Rhynchophorus ferrugineus]|uniref:Uncharacterized protein n=1 Tax=Rhynchophorus ferrugineus TaxID=354439 RepID=A0A834HY30_RHYFE|nr:hypothetical protein GWI33_017649 [Rhynchophorus ferrugineus]
MSGSSEVNLKQTLRKIEYPLCAQEALKKIGELLCSRTTNIKSMDLSLDLMAEFVFWEVDRRGNKRPHPLTPLAELELIEILFEYLSNIPNEATRNTLFLNLFSPITANIRLGVLSKLVSLAVGIPNSNILVCASTWMQQLGNTSISSCKLAESIVFDYIHLATKPEERLKTLPEIAPPFVANLLTAVAENYYVTKKDRKYPPDVLLSCITNWISENSTLCMAAQLRQAALPPGAIAMEATTPIAGLLKWCVLAPIYRQDQEIYSKLYLALLNSISEIPKSNPPRAINVQHLTAIVTPLVQYFRDLKSRDESKNLIITDVPLQLALDRFGQAIQIALSVNAVYGNLDELFNSLQNLPFNKLLSIVINRYNQNKVTVIIV